MSSKISLLALLAILTVGFAQKPPPLKKSPPPKSSPPLKSPPPKSPPLKSPPQKSCGCLTSWKFDNTMWSGCLATGWCATSGSCTNPSGFVDSGGGVVLPWITCGTMQSSPPSPPPLHSLADSIDVLRTPTSSARLAAFRFGLALVRSCRRRSGSHEGMLY